MDVSGVRIGARVAQWRIKSVLNHVLIPVPGNRKIKVLHGFTLPQQSLLSLGTKNDEVPTAMRQFFFYLLMFSATLAFASGGVTVTSPTNNATVPATTTVVASATPSSSSAHISSMAIYLNSSKVYSISAASLSKALSLPSGISKLQVKAWDSSGAAFSQTLYVYSGDYVLASGVTTISNIEDMSGWKGCDACAGYSGSGPSATFWMKQNELSPSLDTNSTEYFIGGTNAYADALWWKQIVSTSSAVAMGHHFVLDLYFYYKNASAPQALEFAVTQYLNGYKLNYGMQCNIRTGAGPQWDISTNNGWKHTGITCPAPPTYAWNHLTIEFERTSTYQLHYIAVTLNGTKHYVNLYSAPRSSSYTGMTFHYQMDGNSQMTDYSTWLDRVSVQYW